MFYKVDSYSNTMNLPWYPQLLQCHHLEMQRIIVHSLYHCFVNDHLLRTTSDHCGYTSLKDFGQLFKLIVKTTNSKEG